MRSHTNDIGWAKHNKWKMDELKRKTAELKRQTNLFRYGYQECPQCGGSGRGLIFKCSYCEGTGKYLR